MKKLPAAVLAASLCAASVSHAQENLPGTYKGSLSVGGYVVGVTLVVASVADGKLSGTGTFAAGTCRGDWPVQGFVKGSSVGLRSNAERGCSFGFSGTAEGNRLVGKMGAYDVELTKQ